MDDIERTVREAVFEAAEQTLSAQLRAIRRLRKGEAGAETEPAGDRPGKSRSQIDMAQDILRSAGVPLHVRELIGKIRESFGVDVDRESLVSALTKRVKRGDRFCRTAPNTFALLGRTKEG